VDNFQSAWACCSFFYKSKTEEAPDAAAPVLDAEALASLLAGKPSTTAKKAESPSVFVDKAVSQIIIAAESAMGEKPSCKATD
jgi:hypothetical protein